MAILKPENLFLTRDGKVKVLDFGLARAREGSPTETKADAVFGTPAFMAPEQALGKTGEVDALSDLWALGATAFVLLTGRLVHQGRTMEETLVLSATQSAPPVALVVHDIPPTIAKIVDRALAFDKADRWPSARAMRDALIHAGLILWGRDASDDLEDQEEEKTSPAPPPQMTSQNDVAPSMPSWLEEHTLESPTVPALSTGGGSESHSQSERMRRRLPIVSVVVCGIGIAIAVVIIVAMPASSKHRALSASEPSTTSLPASASAVRTSSPQMANGPAFEPSAVDVETLPVAPSDHSSAHR